ncbi:glycosyltransferase family 2 protein [Phocaeicola sartorii]|uniref:glycosyltransferase family 2 protein n=1 Tax=Phocaeicola sartorii TaxID=671267 RepID=UPI001362570D|nr:glycosyltransferase family 2 protein [Phocaeicola sartorii]NBH67749.1 nucleotidyl transferase [Phocaeicola sartorii]
MNVIVLMAGSGKDFEERGHVYPKYFLEINGQPIIQRVVESLKPLGAAMSFAIRKEDNDKAYISSSLNILSPHSHVYKVSDTTKGAVCSALFAIDSINNDDELLIINGDQWIKNGIDEAVNHFRSKDEEGGIIVFRSVHPRWSFVALDKDGYVNETSEKRPISDMATAGCYYFKHGKDFVEAAFNTIRKDVNYNGSYYICSTYNELILTQKKVGVYEIPSKDYVSFATPQMYENYLNNNKE